MSWTWKYRSHSNKKQNDHRYATLLAYAAKKKWPTIAFANVELIVNLLLVTNIWMGPTVRGFLDSILGKSVEITYRNKSKARFLSQIPGDFREIHLHDACTGSPAVPPMGPSIRRVVFPSGSGA